MSAPKLFSQMITSGLAFILSAHGMLAPTLVTTRPVETHIKINSYLIDGSTEAEIRSALRVAGPIDGSGQSRDAYTRWKLKWNWDKPVNGMVDLRSSLIVVDVEMTIPRAEVRSARWDSYHMSLVRHEFQHLKHVLAGAHRLLNDFRRTAADGVIPVTEAHRIADAAVSQIRADDRVYDQLTNHGEIEGVRW